VPGPLPTILTALLGSSQPIACNLSAPTQPLPTSAFIREHSRRCEGGPPGSPDNKSSVPCLRRECGAGRPRTVDGCGFQSIAPTHRRHVMPPKDSDTPHIRQRSCPVNGGCAGRARVVSTGASGGGGIVSDRGGGTDASALDGGMAPSIVDVGRVSGCDASCAFMASTYVDVRTYGSLTLPPLR
jgi:hypothetical protein